MKWPFRRKEEPQNEIYVFAPNYYKNFKCIADRCKHNCCEDWEICIDEHTFAKYRSMDHILDTISVSDDGPCFRLNENGRCPHLNDSGLCDIILTHGETYLSDICNNHPRFYNNVRNDRIEAGYGIVCEEACRLILEDNEPFSLSKIEVLTVDESDFSIDCDLLAERDEIISIIQSCNCSFDELLMTLKQKYSITTLYTFDEWVDIFLNLEILDPEWSDTLESLKGKMSHCRNVSIEDFDIYYCRLLGYFVYRHVSVAEYDDDFRARLAFALLSVEMIRLLFESDAEMTLENLIDIARRYSAEIEYSEDNTADLIWEFASEFCD